MVFVINWQWRAMLCVIARVKPLLLVDLGKSAWRRKGSLIWGQVFLIPFADMPPEGITVNALLNKWREV